MRSEDRREVLWTPETIAIEMALIMRRAEEAVREKLAARQLGEAFKDLEETEA